MKKLSLELEKLAVETFEPGIAPELSIGTVLAHGGLAQTRGTCAGIPTCVSPYCAWTVAE